MIDITKVDVDAITTDVASGKQHPLSELNDDSFEAFYEFVENTLRPKLIAEAVQRKFNDQWETRPVSVEAVAPSVYDDVLAEFRQRLDLEAVAPWKDDVRGEGEGGGEDVAHAV